jgi:hypothetical protein
LWNDALSITTKPAFWQTLPACSTSQIDCTMSCRDRILSERPSIAVRCAKHKRFRLLHADHPLVACHATSENTALTVRNFLLLLTIEVRPSVSFQNVKLVLMSPAPGVVWESAHVERVGIGEICT